MFALRALAAHAGRRVLPAAAAQAGLRTMYKSTVPMPEYSREGLLKEGSRFMAGLEDCYTLEQARMLMYERIAAVRHAEANSVHKVHPSDGSARLRDACRVFLSMLGGRSESISGFSVLKALWDVKRGVPRDDLQPGFYADLIHWILALERRGVAPVAKDNRKIATLSGLEASRARAAELDKHWSLVEEYLGKYEHGLTDEAITRREERRQKLLRDMGATDEDWYDYRWQCDNVIKDPVALQKLVPGVTAEMLETVKTACNAQLPFGLTPYYATLIDDMESGRDRAVRAQVLPPKGLIDHLANCDRSSEFDFMREHDTSPAPPTITRRYPAIVIFKPYNTCPQICVYCQRNWEIDEAMAPNALYPRSTLKQGLEYIKNTPAIREVLVTGGDPLTLDEDNLKWILDYIADVDHVKTIRIGTRTPVTLPMRFTPELGDLLTSYREPGRREITISTHFQHVYEVTPDAVAAVQQLKGRGISFFNQLVYTFYASRRFESTALRTLLRSIGVDPYYTFVPKGKKEMPQYRVPIARLLQEQKEEARLLPGIHRTDEVVYNVPGLGKNHIRATQDRDLVSILPDGARAYEFHPWEKNIIERDTYVGTDIPILDYMQHLESIGEDSDEYASVWYYY
jgi:lysine 2,3-aminomutase